MEMSKTIKGKKGPGYEYWSKRPTKGGTSPCKENKIKTHRLERKQFKKELELFDKDF